MSYSESLRYASQVEDGIDRELREIERKQQEYEEIIEDVREEILESFSIFKKNFSSRLNDTEWSNMQEYFEDYEYEVDTVFDEVLEAYYDYIIDKYSFLV